MFLSSRSETSILTGDGNFAALVNISTLPDDVWFYMFCMMTEQKLSQISRSCRRLAFITRKATESKERMTISPRHWKDGQTIRFHIPSPAPHIQGLLKSLGSRYNSKNSKSLLVGSTGCDMRRLSLEDKDMRLVRQTLLEIADNPHSPKKSVRLDTSGCMNKTIGRLAKFVVNDTATMLTHTNELHQEM